MTLFEKLKQLKNISADSGFTEQSRRVVLASVQRKQLTPRAIVLQVLEAAGSLALAGILIFTIVGGFSGALKYLSPVSFSGVDPIALHAEADAIDMQINLADVAYIEATTSVESTSATATGVQAKLQVGGATTPSTASTSTAMVASTTISSSSLSIDEALQQLSE